MDDIKNNDYKIFKISPGNIKNPVLRTLTRIFGPLLERAIGLAELNEIYKQACLLPNDECFCERLLKVMNIELEIKEGALDKIPDEGAVLVTSNHPFGGIDGIILLAVLRRSRQDVKSMVNYMLSVIPEMREMFIYVDPFDRDSSVKTNLRPMRECMTWLKEGHLLFVFPSGEVSSYDKAQKMIRDPDWNTGIATLARKANATVVPMFVKGSNTKLFNLAGMIHPRLRTLLLPRQLINKYNQTIKVEIGSPVVPKDVKESFKTSRDLLQYIRLRTYILSARDRVTPRRKTIKKQPYAKPMEPIINAVPVKDLQAEIAALSEDCFLTSSGSLNAYICPYALIPNMMREIGRLREVTFREVGEGTGKSIDLDKFDEYYLHLFIWDAEKECLVGSYRLGQTDKIIETFGVKGLYTNTLFKFSNSLTDAINPALEMGRSFICQEYQKTYSPLFLLWKGISIYISRNPQYRILFGPVSITNDYNQVSKDMILTTMRLKYMNSELQHLVKAETPPRTPSKAEWNLPDYTSIFHDIEHMSECVSEIEEDGKEIPILLRQYIKMGGEILSFNVDPEFSSVIDALIMVDVSKTPVKILRRYMGAKNAEKYLEYCHAHAPAKLPDAQGADTQTSDF
ncbi:MAG: GNAT family N-acyltransferase [Kiritimatiellia bacterium]